jgi:hypothetical protein
MSLSLPTPVAALLGTARVTQAAPTFTHYEFDATTVKIETMGNFSRHLGATGKAVNVGTSDPHIEISGSLMIVAASQLLKLGDVIKPIDTTGSPWYNIFLSVVKAGAGHFVAGEAVMQDVTLQYNPAVDHSGSTNVDA